MALEFWAKALNTMFGDNTLADWLFRQAEKARRQEALGEVCQQAMRRANFNPANSNFRLVDVGLITYRTAQTPRMSRVTPVPVDTRWLRPFAEVVCKRPRQSQIRLQILDSRGSVLFSEESRADTRWAHARFVTSTWLPLEHLQAAPGRWSVVVQVDGERLGVHRFEWVTVGGDEILEQLRPDGEINDDLQRAVKRGKFRKMSIDELLADQEE